MTNRYFVCILLLILFFYFPSLASSGLAGSLSGKVMDNHTHKPLVNASLYIPDLKLWATSNTEGTYDFNNLSEGIFTIEVSFIGYKSFVGSVKIEGNTIKDFFLSSSVIEIENVTVTGVSSAMQIKRSPLQISVISKKDLERAGGANLLDALSKQPGFSIVTTGPDIVKPFIRGLGYNRVVSVNDGIRQEGQQWGDEHGLEVDEYSAQKIEILRGPASLMYGSDAIGGVINILTNVPVPDKIIRANISGSLNDNNRMAGVYSNIAGNINGFNWNIYGSKKQAGDYRNTYDGNVLNSRFNEMNYGGYVGINKGWGFSHLIFSDFNQNIGMIEGLRNEQGSFILDGYGITHELIKSKKPLVPNQNVGHFKMALDNSFSFTNGSRITALISYQRNDRQEFGDVKYPSKPETHLELSTFNYNAAFHIPVNKAWKTSIGINGMNQTNANKAEKALIPNYNIFDAGLYFYSSKSMDKTTVSGGIRYDFRNLDSKAMMENGNVKFEAFKKQFSNFSASIGIAHELNDVVSLKANISRGFRAPNAPELAANGKHEGTNRYELGDKNLKSETSLSIDGSVQLETEHVSFNIAPFFNKINNYIYNEKLLRSNGTDSVMDGASVFRFTQQNVNMYGIDINFDLHPHPFDWLHFENTLSLMRGKFLKPVDGSQNLPLIAPAKLLTELRVEFPNQMKAFKNIYIKLEMDNVAKQNKCFAGYNTETATPAYTLFNTGIGTDIEIHKRKIASIILALNNITDVAYQSHLSRLKYLDENLVTKRTGVFNMGRNFTARIIVPLEWKLK